MKAGSGVSLPNPRKRRDSHASKKSAMKFSIAAAISLENLYNQAGRGSHQSRIFISETPLLSLFLNKAVMPQ
jgi:hypothetical protein